ncbi:hypothetical protein GCM10027275_23490 [Rhabdobacter roseus]|uniref:Secretion system C-terminal sorting domain-containing protein n=1 Tax=Rhabdobacter roseus TaxID=1655419 RepID=A0A840TXB5_9BACT|nr:hypothetical protein [Rhabdobacter roseus]MBB5284289.1 hypothetical protein [Rhabdobacter roseus]
MKNGLKTMMAAACGVLMSGMISAATLQPKPGQSETVKPTQECKNNRCETFGVGMYRIQNTLKMNLLIEKQEGERLTVRLLNEQGQVLHEDLLTKKQKKYARRLDFSEIKDGRYTVEITNGQERIVKQINLSTQGIVEAPARTLVAMN